MLETITRINISGTTETQIEYCCIRHALVSRVYLIYRVCDRSGEFEGRKAVGLDFISALAGEAVGRTLSN